MSAENHTSENGSLVTPMWVGMGSAPGTSECKACGEHLEIPTRIGQHMPQQCPSDSFICHRQCRKIFVFVGPGQCLMASMHMPPLAAQILQYFPHTPLSFSPHTLLCLICTLGSRRAWQSPAASSGISATSSSHCVSHPPPKFWRSCLAPNVATPKYALSNFPRVRPLCPSSGPGPAPCTLSRPLRAFRPGPVPDPAPYATTIPWSSRALRPVLPLLPSPLVPAGPALHVPPAPTPRCHGAALSLHPALLEALIPHSSTSQSTWTPGNRSAAGKSA